MHNSKIVSGIVPTLSCNYEIFHTNSTPGEINFFDIVPLQIYGSYFGQKFNGKF